MKKFDLKNINDRIVRAAKLDETLYEDIRGDSVALKQSTLVVILSSVAAGIGSLGLIGKVDSFTTIIIGTLAAWLGWYSWVLIIYFVATKLFVQTSRASENIWQLMQLSGFAASCGLLRILGAVPYLITVISFIAGIWVFAAMSVAIKKIFQFNIRRSVVVCIVSWLIQFIIIAVVVSLFINIKGVK